MNSLIRLRVLQLQASAQDHSCSTSLEPNQKEIQCSISLLRERFTERTHDIQQGFVAMTVGRPRISHVQFPGEPVNCCYSDSFNHLINNGNHYQEISSPTFHEISAQDVSCQMERSSDSQEDSNSSDVMSECICSEINNHDWQQPSDCLTIQRWQNDALVEEVESYMHEGLRNSEFTLINKDSNSLAGCTRLLKSFPDNLEIHELLERKTVSTSLASEFRNKMDNLVLSLLQRQGQLCDEYREDQENDFCWSQLVKYDKSNQLALSSLVPQSCTGSQSSEDSSRSSFTRHSYQHVLDMGESHELSCCDIAELRSEISELRKFVESCMDWQKDLEHVIKQEVSEAIHQSLRIDRSLYSSSRQSDGKLNCCICYEMQVDSLLYRCGHMCTCFKCGHELRWGSGICPICQSSIVDVVRAYPNPT